MDPRPVAAALDTALDRAVVPGFSKIGYAVRRRLPTWPADPAVGALAGRHVAVTGATSGLGTATARQLSALGAHVHLIVRNADKAAGVAADLTGPSTTWSCDLGDLDSVRACAAEMLAADLHLEGLVHNAGAMPPTRTESPQGHELSMSLHVLGPVLLTELLLPALEGGDARVVFVTSGGMYTQKLPVDDPDYTRGEYSGSTAYARSKRTQVELLPVLSDRWAAHGIETYVMHPGWAATPGVSDSLPTFDKVMGPLLRDVDAGADTTTWLLAAQPRPTGGGLWMDRRERPTSFLPRTKPTPDERRRMWQWTAGALDLTP
ncbi:SDR family NAD(P)-dependent oxidoreductase [Knoellia sp. Soil729]|uniref:SDR family NAD(P)-dependent oxidoreductase n=1 Tax=Knoellia sp. Soil729 TaxID=1736394 RepID=UPI0006FD8E1E|nr:SDR family NAD(P)-dependent oxidoreductase [Knoellia sp. Soil729]KRE42752.1 dehydrogenase [Knoellia sp. Soil729]